MLACEVGERRRPHRPSKWQCSSTFGTLRRYSVLFTLLLLGSAKVPPAALRLVTRRLTARSCVGLFARTDLRARR